MILRTVGDLKRALAEYPDSLRLVGYDGKSDGDLPVSLMFNDFKDVDVEPRPEPALLVSVD